MKKMKKNEKKMKNMKKPHKISKNTLISYYKIPYILKCTGSYSSKSWV